MDPLIFEATCPIKQALSVAADGSAILTLVITPWSAQEVLPRLLPLLGSALLVELRDLADVTTTDGVKP